MMLNTYLIPAGGTVAFAAPWDVDFAATGHIDGPACWSRPVVGLIYDPDIADADRRALPYSPVVVSEWGPMYAVDAYVEMVGYNSFDCAGIYQPNIDGPIGEAPRRRITEDAAITQGAGGITDT